MTQAMAKEPKIVDKQVGLRIRARRLLLDLSQEALGAALGITFQQVQKYEKGVNRVGASRLAQLAEVLKVPVGWFFASEGAIHPPSDGQENVIDQFISTTQGIALIRAFVQVKDVSTRRAIVKLVERIAGQAD